MAALLICGAIKAEEKQITSPDGKILVTISDKNGQPSYSISYNGTPFIHSSPLGLVTNVGDFSRDMSLGQNVRSNKIDETYTLPNIKQSNVHYVATEAVYQFSQQDKVAFDVTRWSTSTATCPGSKPSRMGILRFHTSSSNRSVISLEVTGPAEVPRLAES